ncbi:MFS general substrate transporter [Testicularia cyperi]|uniref:MFS general substrate transporter n=1 Tax=Testicularia cyperi TaxID=1882483 RepID=A0A317XGA2_9BASI|nr:MFS general substrate transporter [Testicularia cyperi]
MDNGTSHTVKDTDKSRSWTDLPPNAHFFLVFFCLCASSFASALDLTTVSTALPTIVADLQGIHTRSRHGHGSPMPPIPASSAESSTNLSSGGSYIWIGSAYAIGGMAILPWVGGLSDIWGRKAVLLAALVLFLVGSVVCATCQSLGIMILGRTIQGVGDGGIIAISEIVTADLVSLSERGTYEGILGLVWAAASAAGPPIGGIFSRRRRWRWLFYLNIPITMLAITLISLFMKMKKPKTDLRSKLRQMDWIGNLMLIAASISLGLSLTWGGSRFPWTSPAVLVPLIVGVILFALFFYLELFRFKYPTVPLALLSNRTSAAAHATSLLHGLVTMAIIYMLPTYFQAAKLASTIRSGLMVLPFSCTVAVSAIGFAITIEVWQRYLPQNHLGWLLTVAGVPLLLLLDVGSKTATWILVQLPIAMGCGILFVAPQFPVLAAVPVQLCSKALAVQLFFASFGQTLGIMLGESVFQTSMISSIRSPQIQALAANNSFPFDINQVTSPYSLHLDQLKWLQPEASMALRMIYSKALHKVWIMLVPFAVVGWLVCFAMRELEMHDEVDERYAADASEPALSARDVLDKDVEQPRIHARRTSKSDEQHSQNHELAELCPDRSTDSACTSLHDRRD